MLQSVANALKDQGTFADLMIVRSIENDQTAIVANDYDGKTWVIEMQPFVNIIDAR